MTGVSSSRSSNSSCFLRSVFGGGGGDLLHGNLSHGAISLSVCTFGGVFGFGVDFANGVSGAAIFGVLVVITFFDDGATGVFVMGVLCLGVSIFFVVATGVFGFLALSTLGVVAFGGAELSRDVRLGRAAPSGAVRVEADEGAESKDVCRDRGALPRGDKF